MIKKIMLLAILCVYVNLLKGQTYTLDVDAKLLNVNKSFVSSGVLYDRVFPASGLHIFTALDTATYSTITDAVSELYRAQLLGNPDNLNPANGFKVQADSSYAGGSVEIASLFYQYQTIHPNAIENNLLRYGTDSLLYNVTNGSGAIVDPFQSNTIFMAAPVATYCNLSGTTLQVKWGRNRYTNQTNGLAYLQVDAGDGTGYHSLYPGQSFNASYAGSGDKFWHIKGFLSNGATYSCYAYINVTVLSGITVMARRPDNNFQPDNQENENWLVADIGYADEGTTLYRHGTVKLGIYYKDATRDLPANQRKITKPVFISDGFDPAGEQIARLLGERFLLYDKSTPNPKSFISDLNELGYDVIICDYRPLPNSLRSIFNPLGHVLVDANKITGADYIQRNAYAFVKAIQWANQQLQSVGSAEQLTIIGPSMGGLITRYALRWMELNNLPHNCRLWASFDSPHQGANIPLSAQALVAYAANYLKVTTAKDQKEQLLDAAAARQMLTSHYSDLRFQNQAVFDNGGKYSLLNSFYTEINNMGWPQNCRRIAITNGTINGTRNSVPGKEYLSVTAYSTVKILFFIKNKVAKIQCWIKPDAGVTQRIFYGWKIPNAGIIVDVTGDVRNSIDAAPGSFYGVPEALRTTMLKQNRPWNVWGTIVSGPLLGLGLIPSYITAFKNQHVEVGTFDPGDCFIPTKSALAVDGTWNENIGAQNVSTGCGNSRSPFQNYFAPVVNESHVFLSAANVNFFKRELNNQTYQEISPSTYTISGPSVVCTNGNFSLPSAPVGTSVTWSTNPTSLGTVTTGQGSTSVTIAKAVSGNGEVKADYLNTCFKGIASNIVRFGGFNNSDYTISGPSSSCKNTTIYFNSNTLAGATSYNWFWPSGWTYLYGQGTINLAVKTNSVSGVVGLRVANACDAGGSPATKYVAVNSYCGPAFRVTPNPATSQVTVETVMEQDGAFTKTSASPEIKRIRIREKTGRLLSEQQYGTGVVSAVINIQNLKPDVYILQVFDGKVWSALELLVK